MLVPIEEKVDDDEVEDRKGNKNLTKSVKNLSNKEDPIQKKIEDEIIDIARSNIDESTKKSLLRNLLLQANVTPMTVSQKDLTKPKTKKQKKSHSKSDFETVDKSSNNFSDNLKWETF